MHQNLYKLIVLFMLGKIDFSMTFTQISDFILGAGYTDYFTLQSSMSELAEAKLIHAETLRNISYYTITPDGEETIGFFENRIPQAIREDIVQYLTEHKMQMRNEVSVLSDYYRSTSGEYEVRCRVREKQVELIDLTLSVPGEDQARAICQNWKETSQEVYAYLMKILLADHRSEEP